MGDINRTTFFYRKTFGRKEAQFNKHGQLPAYFKELIGDKKEVKIAELGAGVVNTIGDSWPGVKVEIVASDVYADEYNKFWEANNKKPLVPIEYQDFEHLTYPDNSFDIVHCVNALDHTANPELGLLEVRRVCKPGGWVYMRHSPNQMTAYGGIHQWDAHLEGNAFIWKGKERTFELTGFTNSLEGDLIVSIWKKT